MIDLVFFSTNRTKINHFRYLGRKVAIGVKSFKELNYYASYNEPRIDDRRELLHLSYISALQQWQKRQGRSEDETTTFFFEDTSVVINALSSEKEFPGVNVKFWMRETNFEDLDLQLLSLGNDRRATVRSDIVMHLPKKWRDSLGISDEYLWVFGEVSGRIVDREEQIDLNPMFPWLDDKSFNRWFVPDGASSPMSALTIEDADKFDFRERAFQKIVECLRRLNFVHHDAQQRALQLELPRLESIPAVLIICGPTCAGKTTVASWFTDKYEIPHIEASDFMYRAFWERHGLGSDIKIGDFAQIALEKQPDIVSSQVLNHIAKKSFGSVVVTGFRSPVEVQLFLEGIRGNLSYEIIYLDAPLEIRLVRAIRRARDNVNEEKFLARDAQELKMGLGKIRGDFCHAYIENNSSLKDLRTQFQRRYRNFLSMHKLRRRRIKFESNLEPLIILSLIEYAKKGIWLTTTEITSAVNRKFGQRKFKDNISRYFNQTYHPYYDARLRSTNAGGGKTVEYALSTTGMSEAKLLAKFEKSLLFVRPARVEITSKQLSLFE